MSTFRSNKGFTLIELLIVVVIVGMLATIAIGQYNHVFEKARADEAKQGLWEVRVALGQYRMDHRDPLANFTDLHLTDSEFPTSCRPERYFKYSANDTHVIATRCTSGSGGKPPQGTTPYTITLNLMNNSWGGTPGYY
jgi:prepilin-type N-terminal cleavage/methylation domain-containing protein